MKRTILHLPGLLGGDSFLPTGGAWAELASRSKIWRIKPPGPGLQEAALVGLEPESVSLAPGPLRVAAIGLNTPPRSVHFCLDFLSFDGAYLGQTGSISDPVLIQLWPLMERLSTPRFTLWWKEMAEHVAIWENGSLDLGTTPPDEALGKSLGQVLPEGDGEVMLRRFIDDSANLLHDHDLNKQREDEGLAPISMLWPWGQGMRGSLPNRGLRFGQAVQIESHRSSVRGLARLVGFASGFPLGALRPLNPEFRVVAALQGTKLVDLPTFELCREAGRLDYAEEVFQAFVEHLVEPALIVDPDKPRTLTILAPQKNGEGLALFYDTERQETSSIPMDERALGEARLPVHTLCECVNHGFGFASA